ncbi:hypothetical protein WV31_10135 [Magnetospirillum sp. ME-1]|uniref:AAA family ATPase n=1 Tax=Magnetospirillum sp. ME-1 TaxID=1639348 RepID=UPI000A17D89B|nr:AAA family ATPase [Magnetospirillum sp. ME-1]ARJ65985.1 hypothetical protein WV31_10135 [Magnetospirillum sp. ME-1]
MANEKPQERYLTVLLTPHDLGDADGAYAICRTRIIPGAGALVRPKLADIVASRALEDIRVLIGRRLLMLDEASLDEGLNRWLRAAGHEPIAHSRVEFIARWEEEASHLSTHFLPNDEEGDFLRAHPNWAMGLLFDRANAVLSTEMRLNQDRDHQDPEPWHRLDRLYRADALIETAEAEKARAEKRMAERKKGNTDDEPDDIAEIMRDSAPSRIGTARTDEERRRLLRLEDELRRVVFGQDEAVSAVAEQMIMARAGLQRAGRPVGGFLFAGPTGVGKTELARQLAMAMDLPMLRLDMSEYYDRHAISGLIGSVMGYRDSYRGGLLTNALLKNPNHLILFDEIEKGAPEVMNLLLQMLDAGRLTDGRGNTVDCTGATIVMTTNLGARTVAKKNALGFGATASANDETEEIRAAVERGIPPELRNRIDRILVFGRLDPARMPAFVDKGLLGLEAQLRMTGSRLSVTDAAKARLAKEGYSADSGARPLERLIDGRIRRPAARLLIEKPLGSAELRVDHDGEAIAVSVQPIVPPEADPKAAARWTRLHAEAALEDANQARILSIATPLALTTYGAVVKSASTRIIVATPRDIASLQKAESGNPLEPGHAFAAFLAETDGDNDCWFAVPDDDRITVVPNESKALLLDQLFRSTDAAILLFDNRAYEQELVPLLRANRLPVPPRQRIEFLCERGTPIGESAKDTLFDWGYYGGVGLSHLADPREHTPMDAVRWLTECMNFVMGVEEQKRLFDL